MKPRFFNNQLPESDDNDNLTTETNGDKTE